MLLSLSVPRSGLGRALSSTAGDRERADEQARQARMDASGGLGISLHPLVIMNVSEHFTRHRAQSEPGAPNRVFGCLLGTLSGRNVDIANSFELKVGLVSGTYVIDVDFLKTRLDEYKKVFKDYEVLGWYSTAQGQEAMPGDLLLHRQICEITESPMYLVLDPMPIAAQDLPITIYESEVTLVNGDPTLQLSRASYKIDSLDSERISVDHVAHITGTSDGPESSALVAHLGGQQSAIKMLSDRIRVLQAYLEGTRNGTIPIDHAALRQIKSLCNSLPAVNASASFTEHFMSDYNDTLLTSYLSSITQGTGIVNDVVDKFQTAYDKHTRRRGIFQWT
jgi:COP9 signalosome complex subunit 6